MIGWSSVGCGYRPSFHNDEIYVTNLLFMKNTEDRRTEGVM